MGATCGLFAVNHAIAAGVALAVTEACYFEVSAFEHNAVLASIADAPENLVQPGGSNYDWSVLHRNLQIAGLLSHPMTPASLQGETPSESRLQDPFASHYFAGMAFTVVAYILRTPTAGGHWIALLPPATASLQQNDASAALLCDSLWPQAFILSRPETEDLLTACALDNAGHSQQYDHDYNLQWGCFLITSSGRSL